MTEDREAKEGEGPGPPPPQIRDESVPHHVTGRLDIITEHINEYLRYYRMLPWALGAVGMILIVRSTGTPLRRFPRVSDLPSDLVRENKRISGVVMATGWNTIGVWHVPSWRRVFNKWGTHPPSEWCLLFFRVLPIISF